VSNETTALATNGQQALARGILSDAVERVLIQGDLTALNPEQRVEYHNRVCESLGLNPMTRPFEYTKLNGKTVLYARRDCAEQLRRIYGISVTITSRSTHGGIHMVTARASMADGRCDEAMGAVSIGNLSGDNLANALMKAETKAKRRVTLSICGLGFFDETEVSDTPRKDVKPDSDLNAAIASEMQPALEPDTAEPTTEPQTEPPPIPAEITHPFVVAECQRCRADMNQVAAWVQSQSSNGKFDGLTLEQRYELVLAIRSGDHSSNGNE